MLALFIKVSQPLLDDRDISKYRGLAEPSIVISEIDIEFFQYYWRKKAKDYPLSKGADK